MARRSLTEDQLELLRVLKRRNYPLAFREDASNEDILSVMQGKLCHTVLLERNKEHLYPHLVYKEKVIHASHNSESEEEEDDEVVPVEELTIKKVKAEKNLITKWIKSAETGAIVVEPMLDKVKKNSPLQTSSFAAVKSKTKTR